MTTGKTKRSTSRRSPPSDAAKGKARLVQYFGISPKEAGKFATQVVKAIKKPTPKKKR